MGSSTGIPLLARADFLKATGDLHLGLRDLFPVQIAGMQHYEFIDHFNFRKELRGGARIDLHFKVGGAGSYKSGGTMGDFRIPKKKDNVVKGFLDYVRAWANTMVYDDEIEKNDRMMAVLEMGDDDARYEVVYSIYKKALADADFDLIEGIEADYGAVPDAVLMESTLTRVASKMASFFAMLNEDFRGCYGQFDATTANSGVTNPFTTKQGLDPRAAMFTRALDGGQMYAPTKTSYTTTVAAGANSSTNIVSAIKEAIRKSRYDRPPTIVHNGNFRVVEGDEDLQLLGSNRALLEIEAAVLAGQDLWVTEGRQDPTVTPKFGRAGLRWWPILDSAPIYDGATHTTKVTEMAATVDNDGPRVYGRRRASFYPICHDKNYFRVREMPRSMNVPDQQVDWIDLDANLVCEDFPAQFVVSPSGNVY